MAIPILKNWQHYFTDPDEGLGSSYERIILNNKLKSICRRFEIASVLEVPSFGFTGLSGINSMDLARKGIKVAIVDNDRQRLELIRKIWTAVPFNCELVFSKDFTGLPFEQDSFDLTWNFSALWFVADLDQFLSEIVRISRRAVLFCVPNRSGAGYLTQKFLGRNDLNQYLIEKNIFPARLEKKMKKLNWRLAEHDFIDCPPWPDIGMPKEKFLKIFGLNWLLSSQKEKKTYSIIDYYSGRKPDFADQMLQYAKFEKKAPALIKRFWAHHRYLLFLPEKNED